MRGAGGPGVYTLLAAGGIGGTCTVSCFAVAGRWPFSVKVNPTFLVFSLTFLSVVLPKLVDVPRFLSLHLRERVARLLQRIRNGLQLRQRDLADGRRRLARVDARSGEQGDHVRVGREANARGLRHARRVGRTRTTAGHCGRKTVGL